MSCPKQKGKIVKLIGAMSMAGVIASLTYKGGTTKENFLFFIQTILVPVLWKAVVVFMSNYTNQAIREVFVVFLPKYSHELNAIELL